MRSHFNLFNQQMRLDIVLSACIPCELEQWLFLASRDAGIISLPAAITLRWTTRDEQMYLNKGFLWKAVGVVLQKAYNGAFTAEFYEHQLTLSKASGKNQITSTYGAAQNEVFMLSWCDCGGGPLPTISGRVKGLHFLNWHLPPDTKIKEIWFTVP